MDDSRLPKQILYSQLKEGLRGIGRPRLRFKDTVRRNLKVKKFLLVAGNPSAETDANGETWFTRSHLRIRKTANDDGDIPT